MAVGNTYNGIQATWTIPKATSAAPGGLFSYSVDWVGLNSGDSSSSPLIQAGSEEDANDSGANTYRLWFEAYPILAKQNVAETYIGDVLYTHVAATSTEAAFHLDDETAGFNQTYYYYHSLPSNPQAEWIMERPTENGGLPYLADAPIRFIDSKASGTGFGLTGVGALPHDAIEMTTCDYSIELATPGPISSDGLDFSEEFVNPGGGIHDTGC